MHEELTLEKYLKLYKRLVARYGQPDYEYDEDSYWFRNGKTIALTGDPCAMFSNPDSKCCRIEVRPISAWDIEAHGAPSN